MQYTTVLHAVRKQHELSCNEYCIADMIFHLSANPKAPVQGWCNQSRNKMADEMGLSRRTVIDIINTLAEKKLIERNEADFLRTTSLWYDSITVAKEGVQKVHTSTRAETAHPVQEVHPPRAETAPPPRAETAPNNNIIDNNTNKDVSDASATADAEKIEVLGIGEITIKTIALYVSDIPDSVRVQFLKENNGRQFPHVTELSKSMRSLRDLLKPKTERMSRPTLEEVTAYMESKKMPIYEAERFWNHHEVRGWMLSGNRPMQKWKLAVATWMNSPYRQPAPRVESMQVPSNNTTYQDLLKPEFR